MCTHLTTEGQNMLGKKLIELQVKEEESTIIAGALIRLYLKWRDSAGRKLVRIRI